MRPYPYALAAAVLLCGLIPVPAHAQCSSSAQKWHCWETTLPLQNVTGNLYRDLKVKATFTQQGSTDRITYGFWDQDSQGHDLLKIRMFFPAAGTWSWQTTCEAGCSLATGYTVTGGSVTVADSPPPSGLLSVVLDGYPGVSGCGLSYADGVPFAWLGDTAWNAATLATASMWTSYLQDRAARAMTPIQIALPIDYTGSDQPFDQQSPPQTPFLLPDTGNPLPRSTSRWNPKFWQELDRKILQANEAGIVVVVVGLMEGVVQNNANGVFCPPLLADSQVYARNVAARFAGFAVILSPGFDRYSGTRECPNREAILTRIQSIGQVIKATAPHLLATNHWAGRADASELTSFQSQPGNAWLDFQLYQSGHAGWVADPTQELRTALQRAQQLPLAFRTGADLSSCTKANVDGEAIYDQGGPYPFTDNEVRQTAYVSLLSGAGGYTYGSGGLWDWSDPWLGLSRISNLEMQCVQHLEFWMGIAPMVPKPGLVTNNPPAVTPEKQILLAARQAGTSGWASAVAYLPANPSTDQNPPDNPEVAIDFSGLPGIPTNGRWFDPRTCNLADSRYAQGTQVSSTIYKFCRPCGTVSCPLPNGAPPRPACPAEADWVLLLP
jgi:hypothetical protein